MEIFKVCVGMHLIKSNVVELNKDVNTLRLTLTTHQQSLN